MARPLSERERDVLSALLAVDFEGVEALRPEALQAVVIGGCGCGCPSIDFYNEPGQGMHIRVNAGVKCSYDGLFLYTVAERLGGIEWVGNSEEGDPLEFPDPAMLTITPA
jgi:hypothetical protein